MWIYVIELDHRVLILCSVLYHRFFRDESLTSRSYLIGECWLSTQWNVDAQPSKKRTRTIHCVANLNLVTQKITVSSIVIGERRCNQPSEMLMDNPAKRELSTRSNTVCEYDDMTRMRTRGKLASYSVVMIAKAFVSGCPCPSITNCLSEIIGSSELKVHIFRFFKRHRTRVGTINSRHYYCSSSHFTGLYIIRTFNWVKHQHSPLKLGSRCAVFCWAFLSQVLICTTTYYSSSHFPGL